MAAVTVDGLREVRRPAPAARRRREARHGAGERRSPRGAEAILRLHGSELARVLAGHAIAPARWRTPSFGRKVAEVVAHLGPIRSRRMLAASYAREARHGATGLRLDPERALATSPVEVAYALRWLELDDRVGPIAWPSGDPVEA